MRQPHISLGKQGEKYVVRDLKRKGFVILGTNIRIRGAGEIDIAAKNNDLVYCIEVKTTQRAYSCNDPYSPMVRISAKKRKGVEKAGVFFVNSKHLHCSIVFMAALVYIPKRQLFSKPFIQYITWS